MTYKWLNTPKDARCIIDTAVENIGMLLFVNALAKSSPHATAMLTEETVQKLVDIQKQLHDIAMEITNDS